MNQKRPRSLSRRIKDAGRAIRRKPGLRTLFAAGMRLRRTPAVRAISHVRRSFKDGRRALFRAIKTIWNIHYLARIGKLAEHPPRPLRIPPSYAQTQPPPDPPVISIVTPSFNQGIFLERTIASVLDQGYPSVQLIIQDGGSKDSSVEVMQKYGDRLHHWVSEPDDGQADAINRGFRHATGDILAYLNSDDLLLPGSLAYVASYFAAHPEVDAVYGHRVLIDENDMEVSRWVMPPHSDDVLRWADYVPQETLFWRRSLWEKCNSEVDAGFRFAMDWDLLLRFLAADARIVRLPRFLGAFRVHSQQKTSAVLETIGKGEIEKLRLRTLGHEVDRRALKKKIRPYLRQHVVLDRLYRIGLIRY